MNLEINLVKVHSIDAKLGKLLARKRYLVADDTQVMDSMMKFIAEVSTTISTVVTDARLTASLQTLTKLTVTDLDCLRYILSMHGMDIWYWYVADTEGNPMSIPEGLFEYQVIDHNNTRIFIPNCAKIVQASTDNKLTEVYSKIIESHALFNSPIFAGINNPLVNMVQTMEADEQAVGVVPVSKTTYVNSIFDFLHKEIRVLSN